MSIIKKIYDKIKINYIDINKLEQYKVEKRLQDILSMQPYDRATKEDISTWKKSIEACKDFKELKEFSNKYGSPYIYPYIYDKEYDLSLEWDLLGEGSLDIYLNFRENKAAIWWVDLEKEALYTDISSVFEKVKSEPFFKEKFNNRGSK